jgi:hypothetical protein
VLEADPEVLLDQVALDEAFDLGRSLRHAGRVFDELAAVPISGARKEPS